MSRSIPGATAANPHDRVTHGRRNPGDRVVRRASASAMGVLVAATLFGGVASAGALPLEVTFRATESSCVQGTTNKGGVTIQLRSASGDLLASAPAEGAPGAFEACFNRLVQPGHRLRAVLGGDSVSWTIPELTVKPNRASDVVTGKGPKDKRVTVRLYDCAWKASPECVWKVTRVITVRSDGTWRRDFSAQFDARGYDRARVVYESTAGHTYTVQRRFPWMRAVLDYHNGFDHPYNLWGDSYSGLTRTFRLRSSPGGSILATRTATGESQSGQFVLYFGRIIQPGQQVTSTFADDAQLTVWSIGMTVTYKDMDQYINARCLPGRHVDIDWGDGSRRIMADSQGRASVNLDHEESEGYRLVENHGIGVSCQNSRGDIVRRWFRHHYSPED